MVFFRCETGNVVTKKSRQRIQLDLTQRADALTEWARENLDAEQAFQMFALHKAAAEFLDEMLQQSDAEHQETIRLLQLCNAKNKDAADHLVDAGNSLSAVPSWLTQAVSAGITVSKLKASRAGRIAAESRHGKPGQSRSKQDAIRAIWAGGKYSSRDICAEQECAALNMAFGTARRALRNTPDPS